MKVEDSNFNIHIQSYENNSWTIVLTVRQMKFGTLKGRGDSYKFCLNYYFV
jgi:hypothetical protein